MGVEYPALVRWLHLTAYLNWALVGNGRLEVVWRSQLLNVQAHSWYNRGNFHLYECLLPSCPF